jgi:hypothetical protein
MEELELTETNSSGVTEHGYSFQIKRNDFGCLCGYLRVPSYHPWVIARDFNDVDVHGGVTYEKEQENGDAIIGFDCAHAWDGQPSWWPDRWMTGDYRDFFYVRSEIESMSRQVAAAVGNVN